jgi:hypothetical protein
MLISHWDLSNAAERSQSAVVASTGFGIHFGLPIPVVRRQLLQNAPPFH